MKIIKLDNDAFALEPHDPSDRIDALDVDRLRESGISETAIDIYRRYRFGLVGSGTSEVKASSPVPIAAGSDSAA